LGLNKYAIGWSPMETASLLTRPCSRDSRKKVRLATIAQHRKWGR
jgi:hypothetical protein